MINAKIVDAAALHVDLFGNCLVKEHDKPSFGMDCVDRSRPAKSRLPLGSSVTVTLSRILCQFVEPFSGDIPLGDQFLLTPIKTDYLVHSTEID